MKRRKNLDESMLDELNYKDGQKIKHVKKPNLF